MFQTSIVYLLNTKLNSNDSLYIATFLLFEHRRRSSFQNYIHYVDEISLESNIHCRVAQLGSHNLACATGAAAPYLTTRLISNWFCACAE